MACRSAVSLIISTKVRYLQRCGSGRCSSLPQISKTTDMRHMTKRRFAGRLAFAVIMAISFAASAAPAQQAPPAARPGKPIKAGGVLSGELTARRVREGNNGKRVGPYQITSEPRRLPPPNGLCNLETGPETFQLITSSEAQAAQLRGFIGKPISIKVDEVACAQDAGQMSEAAGTKWSGVTKH